MSLKRKAAAGLSAATLAAAAAVVSDFEGMRLNPYVDSAGVLTVCFGETAGVKRGDRYTPEQCREMLVARLPGFWSGIASCIGADLADGMPETRKIAFVSFSYNVGVGAFCKSTLLRKLKASDERGACNELLRWNRAARVILRGLERRRQAERKLCLEGT